MYIQVRNEKGEPLAPTLFTRDVVEGMVAMQGHDVGQQEEPPLGVMLLSEAEAVVEFSRRVNLDRVVVWMTPLQHWLGQKVQIMCGAATSKEAEQSRRHEEEGERESILDTQEGRIIWTMEDIHKLAVNPGGEALRIQASSGSIPLTRMRPLSPSGYMKSMKPRLESQNPQ